MSCPGREPQAAGRKGSQKWLQQLVEHHPALLTDAIRAGLGRRGDWTVEWVSPRARDEWAEYRDDEFLGRVDQGHLAERLSEFWPKCGPRWDGLGKSAANKVVLVEAKSHFGELQSSCGAGERSLPLITRSLDWAKNQFGSADSGDWRQPYYQYANRLAHLGFLQRHGVDAILAFVYFCDDTTIENPVPKPVWQERLPSVYSHLGIQHDLSSRNIVNVFIPVASLHNTRMDGLLSPIRGGIS